MASKNKTDQTIANSTYLNNPNLPDQLATFEYTPEMAKEMKKCKDDICHFAEKYFYITELDRGKQIIELYPAQKRVLKAVGKYRFNVIMAARQCGKCFSGNTKLTIRNKKTGVIEEITAIDFFKRVESSQSGKEFSGQSS